MGRAVATVPAEREIEYGHIPFEYGNMGEPCARLSANVLSCCGITMEPKDGDPAFTL